MRGKHRNDKKEQKARERIKMINVGRNTCRRVGGGKEWMMKTSWRAQTRERK